MSPLRPASRRRRLLALRVGGAAVALASATGLLSTLVPAPSQAAASEDSSITVAWKGDTSAASKLQPTRDPSGFEYDEFQDVKVTVAQTRDLTDQAVQVDVSGFQDGTRQAQEGTGTWTSAMNYMQAMQCWGDPASPDFRQTCEWGGRYVKNNGLGNSVYRDNVLRTSEYSLDPNAAHPVDVPFTPRSGDAVTGRETIVTLSNGSTMKDYPLRRLYGAASSNEVQTARIKSDGTGEFDFEMQTANQAPQLGCGADGNLTCYLVLVPRGTVYGGHDESCSNIFAPGGQPYTYGRPDSVQGGSPINPGCDYWDNRIVVPLTFNPVAEPCPSGAEQRVAGSQLLIPAMSSWQGALCTKAGAAFSFATNPDSIARAQMLNDDVGLAFTSYPVTKAGLDSPDDQDLFAQTALSYAPVAIGATVVSFVADGKNGTIDKLTLSPRLMAKLLTQSYIFEVPQSGSDAGDSDFLQLPAQNRTYTYLKDDPDFQALNPDWDDFVSNPSIVLPGPAGADAIAQLWKWIQSDADARAFLNGEPDKWGMSINPYYLPSSHPDALAPSFDSATGQLVANADGSPKLSKVGQSNIDGTPMSFATADIDSFPKADQSLVPHLLTKAAGEPTTQIDSTQFSPYVDDLNKAAVVAFRANPGAKTGWDPNAIKADGSSGDWVSSGPQVPGQRFVIAVTDAADASLYDLGAASLRSANSTTVTSPDTSAMARAVSTGLVATAQPSVQQVDPAKVSADAYPLTTAVYAVVNLTATQKDARASFARMIRYIVGDGQQVGTLAGQLPAGYLPLTSDLVSRAKAAATAIETYVAPATADGSTPATFSSGAQDGDAALPAEAGSTAAGHGTQLATHALHDPGLTPAASDNPIGRWGLAVALGLGLVGAVGAPLLFRRGRA